jgi:hypothetical protein
MPLSDNRSSFDARACRAENGPMDAKKQLITAHGDENFRKGACHAAEWLRETSRTLAAQGRSAAEITQHLSQLVRVLSDWRESKRPLPDGNPWDWSFKDLASVIKAREQERPEVSA